MTESDDSTRQDASHMDALPEPDIRKRKRWQVSWIWIVPLVAALAGISMLVHAWVSSGPSISISFENAQGIEAGKTEVKFKNVVIGKVKSLTLSTDRSQVLATVQLDEKDEGFASKDSRFWVVRPHVGLGGVSGLGTLLSGPYIGADTGSSEAEKTHFKGLETPPPLTHNEEGTTFVLSSPDLGSLGDIGSPVYFRRIQVGRVTAYHLDKDGQGVHLQVFIKAPNDRFVSPHTRFWNASGVNVDISATGVKLNTESLATVLAGGVAFQQPPGEKRDTSRAGENSKFKLFDSRKEAMTPPDGPPVMISMRFHQPVRGLSVGSPVDFEGITLGKVKSITLAYDPKAHRFPIDVTAVTYPQRMGKAHARFVQHAGERYAKNHGALLGIMIRHGLRAQLRSGNLLTGQQYVSLEFMPGEKANVAFNPNAKPLRIPTVGGSFERIQQQLSEIVNKLNKVPLDQIGNNLNGSLKNLNALLKQTDTKLAPQLETTLSHAQKTLDSLSGAVGSDSPLQQNLDRTLNEFQRAARSLRVLSNYLSRHPEALIRGRSASHAPASANHASQPRKDPP